MLSYVIMLILIPNIFLEAHEISSIANCVTPQEMNQNSQYLNKSKYLIFVSFSMPKGSLKSLYLESKDEATMIIRGLKDDSFKKTAKELQELQIVVDIDPNLFKKYQVTRVPTIVAVHEDGYNSIQGNISFNYAKSKLEEI